MSLLARKQLRGTDTLFTPEHATTPLLAYLAPFKRIWECAEGERHISTVLEQAGHKVVGSDKEHDFLKGDFLECDAIVTNPPFSLKTKFIKRCYESGKPFALLLPITSLEGKERQQMYKQHGLQVLFLPARVDFTGKKAPWFAVAWFTHGLNLPQDMNFLLETLPNRLTIGVKRVPMSDKELQNGQ